MQHSTENSKFFSDGSIKTSNIPLKNKYMKPRLNQPHSDIQKILNTKGFTYLISECKSWIESKEEHLRAYSPEDRAGRLALNNVAVNLDNALFNYQQS